MAYEQKPGSGSLFKNDRKESDSHPDYRGQLMTPAGEECWVSAWIKTSKGGQKYMSLSVQRKGEQRQKPARATHDDLDDSNAPF